MTNSEKVFSQMVFKLAVSISFTTKDRGYLAIYLTVQHVNHFKSNIIESRRCTHIQVGWYQALTKNSVAEARFTTNGYCTSKTKSWTSHHCYYIHYPQGCHWGALAPLHKSCPLLDLSLEISDTWPPKYLTINSVPSSAIFSKWRSATYTSKKS